ncbi:PsbB [Senna tora]|uniref:PsbB (Chloroplast) n=1 Tax=Senna tora TaxID=362788 RepID=A0A834VXI4_9FABA|nr:PsbB [Senna tora]
MGWLEYHRRLYESRIWSYECGRAHIVFSGLCFLAAICIGIRSWNMVSDPYGLTGRVQSVNPAGVWKCPSTPTSVQRIAMGNIETVLSSSIAAVFFAAFVVAGTICPRVGLLLDMLVCSLFFFGHIWHGARTLFRDVFAGIDPDLDAQSNWSIPKTWRSNYKKTSSLIQHCFVPFGLYVFCDLNLT